MSKKFSKNREVNNHYLSIPLKYCFNVPTSNGKDFTIIDDYGKFFLCAWRNSDTAKAGMTFLCRKVFKKSTVGFLYKDKFYPLGKSGWVI